MQKDGDFTSTKVLNISSFRKKVEVKRYLVWIIIAVFIVLSAIPLIADFIFIKRVISNTENFQQGLLTSEFVEVSVMIQQGMFYSQIFRMVKNEVPSTLSSEVTDYMKGQNQNLNQVQEVTGKTERLKSVLDQNLCDFIDSYSKNGSAINYTLVEKSSCDKISEGRESYNVFLVLKDLENYRIKLLNSL